MVTPIELWRALTVNGCVQVTVEAEILIRQQLRGENNLACVMRKVLHHVKGRFEHAHFVLLWGDAIFQPLFRNPDNYGYCFFDSRRGAVGSVPRG